MQNLRIKNLYKMDYKDKTREELIVQLAENEKKFRGLFENMAEGFAYCKMLYKNGEAQDFVYLMVNDLFEELTGLKNVTGKRVSEIIPGIRESDPSLFETYNRVALSGKPERFEMNVTALNMWFSVSVYSPEKEYFVALFEVITERKNTDEALKREKFLMDALMNNVPDHVYFKDMASRFIRISKSHSTSFGLDNPDDATGKTDFDFFTNEHARKALEDEQSIIHTGQTLKLEELLTRPDRPDTWSSTLKCPLYDNFGNIIGTFGISRDITGLKKSEEKLLLLADALKSVKECVSVTDLNDKVLFINQGFIDTYGFTEEDLVNVPIRMIRSPNNPPEITNDILPSTLMGGWHGELMNRRKDGSEFPVQLSTAVVRNNEGEPVALIGVASDISERRKTEYALKQSEERFRSVTQSANDAIITVDSKGNIQGWNRGAEEAFGYKESEIMGKSLRLIIPEYFLKLKIKSLKRLEIWAEKQALGKTTELEGLKKDGTVFPLELSLSQWKTSEENFFTGIVRDITVRKRTELENHVIYEITQGVTSTSNLDELLRLVHTSLRKVIYAENCFIALYDETTGFFSFPYWVDKFDQVPSPQAMEKSLSSYVLRTGKPVLFTRRLFDELKEQNEVDLVGSHSPSWIGIPLQSSLKVIGVLVLQHYEKENIYTEKDLKFLSSIGSQIAISIERKKAEDEIKLKNEQLQIINGEKDKFFSIIAHDLRGPMSAFVAITQILTEEIQTMTFDEIREIIISMKKDASNIYGLLENLLEWSRLKRGVMEFDPVEINLKAITDKCVEVVSESARKKEIRIEIAVPGDIEVLADTHMLETVIRNFVSNAVKFTPVGGKIFVSADMNKDNSVEVKISDTGIGMNQELKNKLFLLNEKTSRKGTEGESSSGLGLLLCKEFIDKHGGKIWVDSEVGKGSTFRFNIQGQRHKGITLCQP
jgi:PAS domain S-box-containing protein